MKIKMILPIIILASLSACQTVSFEERAKIFDEKTKAEFVGMSYDQLITKLGPPTSQADLSDGRKVVQYEANRTDTSGGFAYTTYDSIPYSYTITDKNGNQKTITGYTHIPRTQITPTYRDFYVCKKRFVIDVQMKVQSFNWEGNDCFR